MCRSSQRGHFYIIIDKANEKLKNSARQMRACVRACIEQFQHFKTERTHFLIATLDAHILHGSSGDSANDIDFRFASHRWLFCHSIQINTPNFVSRRCWFCTIEECDLSTTNYTPNFSQPLANFNTTTGWMSHTESLGAKRCIQVYYYFFFFVNSIFVCRYYAWVSLDIV